MVNLQKKSSDEVKQNSIDQGKEFGYNSQDTKAFLKLLYPNKLYKRSVKSKFDLLGTKAGQDTQGSHPRATDRKYRKTGGQKCNRKGHKGHVDLQRIMAAISHDSHIVCTVLKSQSRLC